MHGFESPSCFDGYSLVWMKLKNCWTEHYNLCLDWKAKMRASAVVVQVERRRESVSALVINCSSPPRIVLSAHHFNSRLLEWTCSNISVLTFKLEDCSLPVHPPLPPLPRALWVGLQIHCQRCWWGEWLYPLYKWSPPLLEQLHNWQIYENSISWIYSHLQRPTGNNLEIWIWWRVMCQMCSQTSWDGKRWRHSVEVALMTPSSSQEISCSPSHGYFSPLLGSLLGEVQTSLKKWIQLL